MKDKNDRRSLRTRQLLSEAMVALITEKDYNSITVSNITNRANVGRSTFYAHYHDKDDLLVAELEHVINALSENLPGTIQKDFPYFPSLGLFRHVGEQYELYKSLVWGAGLDLLVRHLQKSLSNRIEQNLEESGKRFETPNPVLANFLAGSFLTLLKWWVENKMMYSPGQMDEMFQKLTLAGMEATEIK